jgi:hypothetical protein
MLVPSLTQTTKLAGSRASGPNAETSHPLRRLLRTELYSRLGFTTPILLRNKLAIGRAGKNSHAEAGDTAEELPPRA